MGGGGGRGEGGRGGEGVVRDLIVGEDALSTKPAGIGLGLRDE